VSKHIILTLQNPLDDSDTLDIKYNVMNTTIGNQWFQHCVDNVKSEPRLEKNFCWLGWPDPNRDVEYLAAKLNECVDTINEFADSNKDLWSNYRIDKNWTDITSDDALNQLHHHFEILMGQVWDVAIYMKSASPIAAYSIRQLNNLVHELASRKTATPGTGGMTVMSYLNPVRELFEDEYYDSFSLNRNFGDIFLHYAQTGKTPIEAFEDNDDYIFNNNINALRYMSGEFNIWWNSSTSANKVNEIKEKLRKWLFDRNVVLQEHENFCYYQDPDGNKQGIGWLTVAKIENQYATDAELIEQITSRLNVYKLSCYENDEKISEVVWNYKWTDSDYLRKDLEYLTPLLPR
jgi:hypothetical protein